MTELLLNNFAAWSAQIAVLIAIGAIAALTLAPGRARLVFWQILLAIALLLPAIEPWTSRPVQFGDSISISMSAATIVAAPRPASFVWHREDWLWIAAAGIAFRALWIAVGLIRLRRHRLSARPLADPPVPFESLGIRWYVSDTVSGPVTFGWLRPSIVLPSRVLELPADLREAIACHELIHVRRRDWLFVIAEEAVRGLFWFHPGVWFALSRIQLAREQTVDSEVVDLMTNRDRYLDALLAVASHKLYPADVAPAPLFLKKRQLAERVSAILKETRMSKPRLIASLATVCSAALIAARIAIFFFPLVSPVQSRAQGMPDSPGVTVDAGAKLMHRSAVVYSGEISGTVMLEATLSTRGEVTDARVLSGPQELRASALQSVLGWHYSTDGGAPPTVQISIKFEGGTPGILRAESRIATTGKSGVQPTMGVLANIIVSGVSPELQQRVLQSLPVHVHDSFSMDQFAGVLAAARAIDEHFMTSLSWSNNNGTREATIRLSLPDPVREAIGQMRASTGIGTGVGIGVSGGIAGGISTGIGGGVSGGVASAPAMPSMIRVGGNVQSVNLINHVTPMYPALAKQARIQGVVHLNAIISQDGHVQNLQVISGHPLLVPAALDAVKQWEYKPTLLNNQPVSVSTQIDVTFSLSEN